MERFVLIALLMVVGCGSDGAANNGDDNSSTPNAMANATPNATPNSSANNTTGNNTPPDRPDLVESPDCFFEHENPQPQGAERDHIEDTEVALQTQRGEYGAFCGSAMEVAIDWESVFASTGFDDDEFDQPGAVEAAVLPFLEGARLYCESGDGGTYRASVQQVLITVTDMPERVGLCFDDASGALVSRFMLDPDATTATHLSEAEVTTWLQDNLQ